MTIEQIVLDVLMKKKGTMSGLAGSVDVIWANDVKKIAKSISSNIKAVSIIKISCELRYCKHNNKGICQKKEINLVQGYDDLVCQQFNYDGYDCKGD